MSNTNREEIKMTINELAKTLNTSSGEWLDQWIRATEPHATSADLAPFLAMARKKRDDAQRLVEMLFELEIELSKQ